MKLKLEKKRGEYGELSEWSTRKKKNVVVERDMVKLLGFAVIVLWVFISLLSILIAINVGGHRRNWVVFNLFDTLKQSSLFSFYSFIEFVSIFYVLMEGSFPSVGMSNPLKRVLTDEDLD